MGQQGLVTAGEACRRTGITRKALRLYEEEGLVEPAARTPAGNRLYDEEALRRIEFVRRARLLGFSLAEAKEFLHVAEGCCGEHHPRLLSLIGDKVAETERRIAELERLRGTLRGVLERLSVGTDGGHRCEEALCLCAGPFLFEGRR